MNILLLCERAAITLFASVWHAALLLAIVAIALDLLPRLGLLPRMTAAARSLIWTAALLLVAILPLLSHPGTPTTLRVSSLQLNPAWSLAIAAIWIAFSAFRAVQLIASAIRLQRIRAAAIPIETSARVELPFGLHRSATLCVSAEVTRPSVIGFFSPRILIPSDLHAQLSDAEIDHIVLHEMEHLRRLDDWRNLVQKIAVMLFPLNPALLWIERRLCFERELACDESVLAQTNAPRSYAACLVHLAEQQRALGRQISLALGAWERRSELGRRVHGILANRPPAPGSARVRAAWASAVTAGMVACALLLSGAPQLLSFTAPAPEVAAYAAAPLPIQNVTFRADPAAQPRMIDTMLRVPSPSPVRIKRLRPRTQHLRQIAFAPATQPRMILTAWTYSDRADTVRIERLTFAVFELSNGHSSSSEVALPTPGGLLIIQL